MVRGLAGSFPKLDNGHREISHRVAIIGLAIAILKALDFPTDEFVAFLLRSRIVCIDPVVGHHGLDSGTIILLHILLHTLLISPRTLIRVKHYLEIQGLEGSGEGVGPAAGDGQGVDGERIRSPRLASEIIRRPLVELIARIGLGLDIISSLDGSRSGRNVLAIAVCQGLYQLGGGPLCKNSIGFGLEFERHLVLVGDAVRTAIGTDVISCVDYSNDNIASCCPLCYTIGALPDIATIPNVKFGRNFVSYVVGRVIDDILQNYRFLQHRLRCIITYEVDCNCVLRYRLGLILPGAGDGQVLGDLAILRIPALEGVHAGDVVEFIVGVDRSLILDELLSIHHIGLVVLVLLGVGGNSLSVLASRRRVVPRIGDRVRLFRHILAVIECITPNRTGKFCFLSASLIHVPAIKMIVQIFIKRIIWCRPIQGLFRRTRGHTLCILLRIIWLEGVTSGLLDHKRNSMVVRLIERDLTIQMESVIAAVYNRVILIASCICTICHQKVWIPLNCIVPSSISLWAVSGGILVICALNLDIGKCFRE